MLPTGSGLAQITHFATGPGSLYTYSVSDAGVITFFVMRSRRSRAGSFGPPGR